MLILTIDEMSDQRVMGTKLANDYVRAAGRFSTIISDSKVCKLREHLHPVEAAPFPVTL